jgi:5-(carboxyamino)imidazole ribonucleotide synthase
LIQKTRKAGYDGKGVKKISSSADLQNAFDEPSVIENCIDIEKEISVIVARNDSGEIKNFPVVEMEFNAEANLVELLLCPSTLANSIQQKAILIAEMFVTKSGEVLVNEIAPRPHNSGHHTIEANVTSQYEQHLRTIFNLPLGDTSIIKPTAMVNILGEKGFEGTAIYHGLQQVLKIPQAYVHLYGKKITRPFRKMGHVTVLGNSIEEAKEKASAVRGFLKVIA